MASPLTLLMPVIPGTNPVGIAQAIASNQPAIDNALTSIGTVHYARFVLLDRSQPNLQPLPSLPSSGQYVIGVITEYDGAFDPYISDFANQIGGVFDALLGFVVGGQTLVPVVNNLTQFTAFIKANDASQSAPNNTLYQAYPTLTVQQILANG